MFSRSASSTMIRSGERGTVPVSSNMLACCARMANALTHLRNPCTVRSICRGMLATLDV
jgi:hypothetical protein